MLYLLHAYVHTIKSYYSCRVQIQKFVLEYRPAMAEGLKTVLSMLRSVGGKMRSIKRPIVYQKVNILPMETEFI